MSYITRHALVAIVSIVNPTVALIDGLDFSIRRLRGADSMVHQVRAELHQRSEARIVRVQTANGNAVIVAGAQPIVIRFVERRATRIGIVRIDGANLLWTFAIKTGSVAPESIDDSLRKLIVLVVVVCEINQFNTDIYYVQVLA